jgi:uncharacterized damage-inducible protein DinB
MGQRTLGPPRLCSSTNLTLQRIAADDVHEIGIVDPAEARSRQELLQALDESTAGAKETLQKMHDKTILSTWTAPANGKTILSIPRVAFIRSILMNHIIHHRGRLSVYLRLLNVPVPSIYGPSADENPFR